MRKPLVKVLQLQGEQRKQQQWQQQQQRRLQQLVLTHSCTLLIITTCALHCISVASQIATLVRTAVISFI